MRKLVIEKCTALDNELELFPADKLKTGDEQLVTRTMLKLAGWRNQMESISVLYQELLTKTAVHKLPEAQKAEVAASFEGTKATLDNVAITAEEEDLRRQLYSLETQINPFCTFGGGRGRYGALLGRVFSSSPPPVGCYPYPS